MISDPQTVTFSNDHVRKFADKIGGAYLEAKKLVMLYQAKGIEAIILSDPSGYIEDKSELDGRTSITGGDIYAIKQIALWIITNSESDFNYTVNTVMKVAVNPE